MIVKKLYFMILNLMISFILNIIPFYLIVLRFGTIGLGTIGYAMSSVIVFSFLYDMGLDMAFMKVLPQNQEDVESKIGTYFYMKLILVFISIVVSVIFTSFWSIEYVWNDDIIFSAQIFILYMGFQGVSSSFTYIYNSTGKMIKSQIPQTIGYIVQTFLIILFILGNLDIRSIVLSYLFSSSVVIIINIILFRGNRIGHFSKKYLNQITKILLPLLIVASLFIISENIDTILMGLNYNLNEVGIYQFVIRLKPLLFVVANTILFIFIPIFTNVYSKYGNEHSIKILSFFERLLFVIGIPFALIIFFLNGPVIMFIFGMEMEKATLLLSFYGIVATFTTFIRLYGSVLLGCNQVKEFFWTFLAFYGTIIILDLILINKSIGNLDSWGCLISRLIGSISGYVVSLVFLKKKLQFNIQGKFWIYLLNGSICVIIYFALKATLHLLILDYDTIFFDSLVGLLSLFVYIMISFLTKSLNKSDIQLIKQILNPSAFMKMIITEVKEKSDLKEFDFDLDF